MKPQEISKKAEQLEKINVKELPPLPPPYEDFEEKPITELTDDQKQRWEHSLDGVSALNLPRPETPEEEQRLVEAFLEGFRKLLTKEDNWAFLQPLSLSLEYCAKCQTCADACPIYEMSGRKDIYRPIFRAEVSTKNRQKISLDRWEAPRRFPGA